MPTRDSSIWREKRLTNELPARVHWRRFLQSTRKDGSTAPWLLGGLISLLALFILTKSRPKLRSKLRMLGPPLKLPSKQSPSQSEGAPGHYSPSGPDHSGAHHTQGPKPELRGAHHTKRPRHDDSSAPDHPGAAHTQGSKPDSPEAHHTKRPRHDDSSGPDHSGAVSMETKKRSGRN
jgi:hypothetical protein